MDPRLGQLPRPTPQQMIAKLDGKATDKPSLCPFGCTEHAPTMNQHGYCRHLIGWSADGKTFERRERVVNTDVEICRAGKPPHKILETDVCVPMQSGLRVYRATGNAPLKIAKPIPESLEPEVPDEELEAQAAEADRVDGLDEAAA